VFLDPLRLCFLSFFLQGNLMLSLGKKLMFFASVVAGLKVVGKMRFLDSLETHSPLSRLRFSLGFGDRGSGRGERGLLVCGRSCSGLWV
jgi:hypothetical protein